MKRKHSCFALFSGGLDSILAVLHMKSLGYEVMPIFFSTPFFGPDRAQETANKMGINLIVHDLTELHLKMIEKPKYGYGKNLNPCIDCHGLMFHEAGRLMKEYNVDFIISGEVIGQRPMSQRKDALNSVGKLSGIKDLLIRPLSQKLLSDTLPIREGWVIKDEMLDIQGRNRKRQMKMAQEYGIDFYPSPGGGCLLTDAEFSNKLKDLMQYNMMNERSIEFLKTGRHLRLNDNVKLIIGRNNDENNILSELIIDEIVLQAKDIPGPLGIIQSNKKLKREEIKLACSIILRYNSKIENSAIVQYGKNYKLNDEIEVEKMAKENIKQYLL
ncbi:MAG: tRNA (5-methylaminomethyl-2-thiouridylate)-methyltransferase [Candidatus Cloacimonadota bacterium]|nr:tRNA (5-methylaminomethyl-2-thiouridylate)-methyltransferase [Candidatus Cloacimonadota bacterium]